MGMIIPRVFTVNVFSKFKGNSNSFFINPSSYFHSSLRFDFQNTFLTSLIHSKSCSNSNNGEHSQSIYQKFNNLDDALNLFDQMTQRQPLPSIIKFNQLLQSVTKMKHYSHSLLLFQQMCALRAPLDKYTMSIVIKCCCQLHRTQDGFSALGFCSTQAIVPNVFIFSALLDGLILEDRILEAEIVFKKLIKQKLCEPNVVMYNIMIKGLCKFSNNVIAISLLKLMDEWGCTPDVFTYNTIIDSLCKDKMIDDAFVVFKEMVFQKHISSDFIIYNSLIDGLYKLGRWEEAFKMLKEMLDVGISPNVRTSNILVDAFSKEGKLEEAENVINIMLQRGIVPDIITYTSLIDGYCLRGEMSKAKSVYDLMTSRRLLPNIITYNSLVNGYCKTLMIDEAKHLFHEITKRGLKPDVVTYNTVIQGLFRVGSCGDARKLFDEMCAKGLKPNECTLRIIIEGLCNNRQIEEALSLFHLMGDSKLNYDIVVYSILIDGVSKCGKLDIAREALVCEEKQLFLKMAHSGCPPNNVTYRLLLQGYLRNQCYDDVDMLLHDMDGRVFSLDASTVSLFIDKITVGSLDTSLLEPTDLAQLATKVRLSGFIEGGFLEVLGSRPAKGLSGEADKEPNITRRGFEEDILPLGCYCTTRPTNH